MRVTDCINLCKSVHMLLGNMEIMLVEILDSTQRSQAFSQNDKTATLTNKSVLVFENERESGTVLTNSACSQESKSLSLTSLIVSLTMSPWRPFHRRRMQIVRL